MKCTYIFKTVDYLYYNSHPQLSAMKHMFISKDLYVLGMSPFDERWLKSVGVYAALPHVAEPGSWLFCWYS